MMIDLRSNTHGCELIINFFEDDMLSCESASGNVQTNTNKYSNVKQFIKTVMLVKRKCFVKKRREIVIYIGTKIILKLNCNKKINLKVIRTNKICQFSRPVMDDWKTLNIDF